MFLSLLRRDFLLFVGRAGKEAWGSYFVGGWRSDCVGKNVVAPCTIWARMGLIWNHGSGQISTAFPVLSFWAAGSLLLLLLLKSIEKQGEIINYYKLCGSRLKIINELIWTPRLENIAKEHFGNELSLLVKTTTHLKTLDRIPPCEQVILSMFSVSDWGQSYKEVKMESIHSSLSYSFFTKKTLVYSKLLYILADLTDIRDARSFWKWIPFFLDM